jgi:hypothetical protein
MKKPFLILLAFLSLQAQSAVTIVSDLDDTIKITHSALGSDAARYALFSDTIFTGMSEFFKASKYYANEMHVLSASPIILRGKILSTLKKHHIQHQSLILKNAWSRQSKFEYKLKELKKLFAKSSDDFILIGDDVAQDPESYEAIAKLYPHRVLGIYIHVVTGRKLPALSRKYWTSFDLFMEEFLAKRMNTSWIGKAAEIIIQEKNMKLVFPDFAQCPTDDRLWHWQIQTIFSREATSTMGKILHYCKARHSTI